MGKIRKSRPNPKGKLSRKEFLNWIKQVHDNHFVEDF